MLHIYVGMYNEECMIPAPSSTGIVFDMEKRGKRVAKKLNSKFYLLTNYITSKPLEIKYADYVLEVSFGSLSFSMYFLRSISILPSASRTLISASDVIKKSVLKLL